MLARYTPILSIIITAHSESILTHRTIASVRRALNALDSSSRSEIILHVDNTTPQTEAYINSHRNDALKDIKIYINTFGDLGASRNFAIQKATGKYIATIDADDIMSEQWLASSISLLESCTKPTVAHSEYTVEFEGADSLIVKHGEINYNTDTLLSVYANRWNSVIVAPRQLLLDNPYTPNSPGYGYEDWNLNCRLIHAKVHNVLVPETAIFVRRKKSNSEWQRQIQSMSVLRANPLLSFSNIRSVCDPFNKAPQPERLNDTRYYTVARAKSLIKRYPAAHRIAKYVKKSIKRRDITPHTDGSHVPTWLRQEWLSLHAIDKQIFPSQHLMETIPVYDTLTEDHKITGSLYKALVDQLDFDYYAYIIFAPWLTKGGADKYTIEYANTIAQLTNEHVLIVATLPVTSPWKDKLSKNVNFLDFGNTTIQASQEIRQRLMEHIVENSGAKALHVINSEFGYDFIRLHENYIKSSGKKVIVTSFSQSIDPETKRVYGYSHTHVPFVYDIADIITSDNQAVLTMWVNEYGFDPKKLAVHHQPIDLADAVNVKIDHTIKSPVKLLWAARVAPEKLPGLVVQIGKKLGNSATIDMYGVVEPGFTELLHTLPTNIRYKGAYDGFSALETNNYDALLYTSLFDGMPNTLLEAAEAKLPIVASDVGGISEFIEDKKTGRLVSDIYNVNHYVKAIQSLTIDNNAEVYAMNAYKKIGTTFSREQYTKSVSNMLVKIGLLK